MKAFIIDLYGSQKACAKALGVNRKTVYRWIYKSPWPMIKYADKIANTAGVSKIELIDKILNSDGKRV